MIFTHFTRDFIFLIPDTKEDMFLESCILVKMRLNVNSTDRAVFVGA